MGKKKKDGANAKKIHIRDIDSCVSLVLHALPLKEILRAKVVSKWFREGGSQALGLLTDFDYEKHGLDSRCLGYILACYRNIRSIRRNVEIQNIHDVFGALRSWRNLKELGLTANAELDRSLQGMILPQIAAGAPKLEVLLLENILKGKVYLTPLSTLKNLNTFHIYDDREEESEIVGLETVLRNCPISSLGIDRNCDFFLAANACDEAVVERIVELELYSATVTSEHCSTVSRLSNLRQLTLISQDISNDGIQVLSSLQYLVTLEMSFDNLTPRGMSFLASQDGFTALRELNWKGHLPFDEEWLEMLERSHGGLVVQKK